MLGWHRGLRALTAVAVTAAAAGLVSAASGAGAPTPILTRSVVLTRTSGVVSYTRPGSPTAVALGSAAVLVPVGTTVVATAGVVRVTIATTTPGVTASALFYTGRFAIAQKVSGIATVTLDGPLAPCPTGATGATGATRGPLARSARRRPQPPPKTRSLWGDGGSGDFTTVGHFAAATVLGTVWLTTDSCTATVVSVAEGHVSVANLVNATTVTVAAGQALSVRSTGMTATAPFTGPTSPPSYPSPTGPSGSSGPPGASRALTISSDHAKVSLGEDYTLTATGTAAAGASAYIYENVGSPCSPTLDAERGNSVAIEFSEKALSAGGAFTLTARALAQHTGTKYYCAYLTDPASHAQTIVTVGASSSASTPVRATSANGAITLGTSSGAVTLGTPYTLTLTGRAAGSATAYIYENTGSAACGATLAAERSTADAYAFGSKSVAAGTFTQTASALAQHTGRKYYCGYLTDPASAVQVVVTVSP